jgi:TctA family transporter
MLEENFRLAIKLDQGNYFTFFEKPIVLGMLFVVTATFCPKLLARNKK